MIRRRAGASVRELAALSQVSTVMISRIETGKANPSTAVMSRLLEPLGYTYQAARAMQPGAIAAARKACDPGWAGGWPDGADEWTERFARAGWLDGDGMALPDKKTDLLFRAGLANRILDRPEARFYTDPRQRTWADQIIALHRAGVDYALTGGPAANQLMPMGGGQDLTVYTASIDRAAEALGLEPAPTGWIALLPYNGVCEVGTTVLADGFYANNIRMVAFEQILMDCVAMPKAGLDQAEFLTGRRI